MIDWDALEQAHREILRLALLLEAGFSVDEVADAAGISRRMFRRRLIGLRRRLEELAAIRPKA